MASTSNTRPLASANAVYTLVNWVEPGGDWEQKKISINWYTRRRTKLGKATVPEIHWESIQD
jgi:hypothetical protein